MDQTITCIIVFAAAFSVVLGMSIAWRLRSGASIGHLLRTKCHECVPARALLGAVGIAIWVFGLEFTFLLIRAVHLNFWAETRVPVSTSYFLGVGVSAAATLCFAFWYWMKFVVIEQLDPISLSMKGVGLKNTVSPAGLAELGNERFPHNPQQRHHNTARVVVILVVVAAIAMVGWAVFADPPPGWVKPVVETAEWVKNVVAIPIPLAIFFAVATALVHTVMLRTDRNYLLFSFPVAMATHALLLLTVGWSIGSIITGADGWLAAIIASWIPLAIRCGSDLAAHSWHKKSEATMAPIRHDVGIHVRGLLDKIPAEPGFELSVMNRDALGKRISQGCANVEEAGCLVTRSFARYLELCEAEQEHTAAAMLRFLIVRRSVSESAGRGTYRGLQDPQVPMWDETLFPLKPPKGYVDWLDPLSLIDHWDRVSVCGSCYGSGQVNCIGCGGSGQVERPAPSGSYSSDGQPASCSGTVTENCSSCGGSGRTTCGTCGGAGRLEFARTLNTEWIRILAITTSPGMANTDLVEDAEERVYFRYPIWEHRQSSPAPAELTRGCESLGTALHSASQSLVQTGFSTHKSRLEKLHGGYLYRSDFQVTGFWTVRIVFERLRGGVGWFFGKRPEFHFPKLPIGWATIGTIAFAPPLGVLTIACAVTALWRALTL